jgi:hypothetical protein
MRCSCVRGENGVWGSGAVGWQPSGSGTVDKTVVAGVFWPVVRCRLVSVVVLDTKDSATEIREQHREQSTPAMSGMTQLIILYTSSPS